MSIVVNIRHKKETKIGYNFLRTRANFENLYVGIQDEAYCLDDYQGDEDIRGIYFVLFSREKFHRGFGFKVDEDYNIELVLNYPCSKRDVMIFYKFINDYCLNFDIPTFTEEGEEFTLKDIPELQNEKIEFNKMLIRDDLKSGLTIFGCIYPITLDDDFILGIRYLDPDRALNAFANYLDKLQRPMYYFAKPALYYSADPNKYIAKYSLTKDVPSIFPINAHLPFGYDEKFKDNIVSWQVVVAELLESNEFKIHAEMSYDEFCQVINLSKYPKFDKTHVLITVDDKALSKIAQHNIQTAQETMINWLSDYRELGCKPAQIEFTKEFVTEDGIHCYIFKYKKTLLSNWWLGIVSESGTFSEFKEYNQATEITDAIEIINLLKTFWKKEAERIDKEKENG